MPVVIVTFLWAVGGALCCSTYSALQCCGRAVTNRPGATADTWAEKYLSEASGFCSVSRDFSNLSSRSRFAAVEEHSVGRTLTRVCPRRRTRCLKSLQQGVWCPCPSVSPLRKVQVSCRTLEGTKVLQQDKQEAVLLLGKTDAAPGLFCAISLCTSNHRLVYLISQSNLCISDVHVY